MDYLQELNSALTPLPQEFTQLGLSRIADEQHELQSDFPTIRFANANGELKLKISISKKVGSITTFFAKDNRRSWELETYIKNRRAQENLESLFFQASTEEYVRNLCVLLRDDQDLRDVITGKKWFDFVFDWTSY